MGAGSDRCRCRCLTSPLFEIVHLSDTWVVIEAERCELTLVF